MHSRLVMAVPAESFAHCDGQRNTIPRAAVTRLTEALAGEYVALEPLTDGREEELPNPYH